MLIQYLPGQRALQEVHEHVAEGLHVVPARILDALVRVHGGVADRPHHALVHLFVIFVVHLCDRVFEIPHESKVNDINFILIVQKIPLSQIQSTKGKKGG